MNEYDGICLCDEEKKGDKSEWGREVYIELNGFLCDWHSRVSTDSSLKSVLHEEKSVD